MSNREQAGLTPTMLAGLKKMARYLERRSETMAEPNDNTGRALLNRGLLEFVHQKNGWNYYRITPAGRAALANGDGK